MRLETSRPRHHLLCLLSGLALLSACGNDTTTAEDAGETTAASSTAADTGTSEVTTLPAEETETAATTDADTANFIATEGPDTGMEAGTPGMLGDMCQTDAECAEDLFCNGIPGFGGICSECASDADCPDGGNCTITQNGWFACGDGGLGQMCESDESCAGDLYCAEVVDLGGFFNGNFCSTCAEDAHCENGQLCAPQIEFMDIMNIGGQRACIDPNTAPDGSLCDHDGTGDEQCAGFCTEADLMGFITLGVCGECESDMDCPDMGTCVPAMVGLNGFGGSTCN